MQASPIAVGRGARRAGGAMSLRPFVLVRAWACVTAASVAAACGTSVTSVSTGKGAPDASVRVDARPGDAARREDARPDAPRVRTDAARTRDARAPVDGGRSDASGDAGELAVDGGLALAMACTGTPAQVYAYVPNLPPMTDALRGTIVACTSDGTIDAASVQSQLTAESDTGVTAVTGVSIYRVQYRTTRANGSAATSSARIYLPLVPIAATPPVIVASHGTEGLAAMCTTSMDSTSMRDLALPWAALGYPVIAPDYAGLGTPGVQGYTDNHDTARSVIDSVAALRKFVSAPLSQKVVVDGHSQGGGAALATQALATSMGLDGTLTAVIAFAPEYYSHLDALGYLGALESVAASNPLSISTGVTKIAVATMMEYAYFANYVPGGSPTAGYPASNAVALGAIVDSQCIIELGGAAQGAALHVADWTDPTLRGELLACVAATDAGAPVPHLDASAESGAPSTCTGAGAAFFAYLQQNIIPPDAHGAPVLLVQGLKDEVMPPDEEAACNVIQLENGGLTPQVCTDATASHTDVSNRNIGFAMQWAQAVLAGAAPPPCAASALPACSQP